MHKMFKRKRNSEEVKLASFLKLGNVFAIFRVKNQPAILAQLFAIISLLAQLFFIIG